MRSWKQIFIRIPISWIAIQFIVAGESMRSTNFGAAMIGVSIGFFIINFLIIKK